NHFNQTVSCTTAENDTNSASIVDRAVQDYFLLLHYIAPSFCKKANSKVDFLSFKSPPQSTSI
ncbi:hypothetical protein P3X46_001841, partial [Hevea brasiliensis]